MKAKVSWHGDYVEGDEFLKTVGALVLADDDIFYVANLHNAGGEAAWNDRLDEARARRITAKDIFEYYIDRSNGVTESYSLAEDHSAKTRDDLINKLRERMRERG